MQQIENLASNEKALQEEHFHLCNLILVPLKHFLSNTFCNGLITLSNVSTEVMTISVMISADSHSNYYNTREH
jgi:hypothetical protein